MKKIFPAICLLIMSSFLILTCDKEESMIRPEPPVVETGDSISDEVRMSVLNACQKKINGMGGIKTQAQQIALLTWLASRPEFSDMGFAESNLYANFRDGVMVMFVDNLVSNMTEEEAGGRIGDAVAFSSNSTGRTEGIPLSNQVQMFRGLGENYINTVDRLKSVFEFSHTAYQVKALPATVENLKHVNAGVFYIYTHGGQGYIGPNLIEGTRFALWTTDSVTTANQSKYRSLVRSKHLIYMFAPHNTDAVEKHYAITDKFVDTYFKFSADALLYVDACSSFLETDSGKIFRKHMIAKSANGRATYLGWTKKAETSALFRASHFIFDRLLGKNGTHEQVPKPDPIQRPFNLEAIYKDLVDQHLYFSQEGGILKYETNIEAPILLTPSIEYININDYVNRIWIKGIFGDDPKGDGIVTVDGVEFHADQWGKNLITCVINETGRGSSGDVVVSVRGNKSNTVPLTEWTIPLTLARDNAGIKMEAHINLRFRADIHSYRHAPGDIPKRHDPDTLDLIDDDDETYHWPFAIGSSGTYSIHGQRTATCDLGCVYNDAEIITTTSGPLPYTQTSTVGAQLMAGYVWDNRMRQLIVKLGAHSPLVATKVKHSTSCAGIVSTDSTTITNIMALSIPSDDFQNVVLTINDDYTISKGEFDTHRDSPFGTCGKPGQTISIIKWPEVKPEHAPTMKTEARSVAGRITQ